MSNGNLEERAWECLQWSSPAPLAPFDEVLAAQGFYSRIQRERSDKALDAFDKKNPPSQTSELNAFRELEREGQIKQSDFFSPDKADRSPRYIDPKRKWLGTKNTTTSYSDDLKQFKQQRQQSSFSNSNGQPSRTCEGSDSGVARNGLDGSNAESIRPSGDRARRSRRRAPRLPQSGGTEP